MLLRVTHTGLVRVSHAGGVFFGLAQVCNKALKKEKVGAVRGPRKTVGKTSD